MKSKLLVITAMVLNVVFMLFALYGQNFLEYAPTIGWLGAFITSLLIFISYLKEKNK